MLSTLVEPRRELQPLEHPDPFSKRGTRSQQESPFNPLSTTPIPLCIVSESQLLREGLLRLLQGHLALTVLGSYADPPLQPPPQAHIALLDAQRGAAATRQLLHTWLACAPDAALVVIEVENDAETILSYIEAGAKEYTLQGESATEVAGAILRARQGTAKCPPEIVGHLFARLAALSARAILPPVPDQVPLTPRELDVLRCIAQDQSNQQIAEALSVEVCTVKHHVHNILQKLKLRHRWDAARLAQERGWLG